MDIFDCAMRLEKDGSALYRECALKSGDEGLKTVFTWLAEQEDRHYELFSKMKEGSKVSIESGKFLEDVKEVFAGMRQRKERSDFDLEQKELYREASLVEKKSYDYYMKEASAIIDKDAREAVIKIANEEKRHYVVMENIIEFVTKPDIWVENAEFNHLDKDYYL